MGHMVFQYKLSCSLYVSPIICKNGGISHMRPLNARTVSYRGQSKFVVHGGKPPREARHHRRSKIPPDIGTDLYRKKNSGVVLEISGLQTVMDLEPEQMEGGNATHVDDEEIALEDNENIIWDPEEVDAISSLFQGRIPQKPGKVNSERPLPLPLPHRLRPVGLPTAKRRCRVPNSDKSPSCAVTLSKHLYKDPSFLIGIAREIRGLPKEDSVASVLNKCQQFLRKGSLSLTIRELGHMGLPERALQTCRWAQRQPHLFPDDRILASTVEILAATRLLRFPDGMEKSVDLASRSVLEAMIKGFVRGGNLNHALKLLMISKKAKRTLASSVYANLILELGKNPDKRNSAIPLLEELAERDELGLNQQDCMAVMKACICLKRFEVVESLFNWYKQSGHTPSADMYATVIKSRHSQKKYREALVLVWEMEGSDCILGLTAYRVLIKLFVALNDLPRAARYFSKLKEAGFCPPYDVYRDLIHMYCVSGRLAKCKEICKELELVGFTVDAQSRSLMSQLESKNMSSSLSRNGNVIE